MGESPIILEGVTLMLLGMGFVFFFLVLLVGATRLLSTVSMKLQPIAVPKAASNAGSVTEDSDDTVVAAITAALHHHKKKLSQQA
ncbi:OadG family transporter subunit [Vibrio hannami]|uniref:OadG family protein n=1 Tax=Vibrio hannami TaxID=2717094 RepID=UPI00241060DE|nr:OadG family transporter subunit [Vibrio hannami]MDG3085613.1 OadG family transporter subunit [Vibrio hannami]